MSPPRSPCDLLLFPRPCLYSRGSPFPLQRPRPHRSSYFSNIMARKTMFWEGRTEDKVWDVSDNGKRQKNMIELSTNMHMRGSVPLFIWLFPLPFFFLFMWYFSEKALKSDVDALHSVLTHDNL